MQIDPVSVGTYPAVSGPDRPLRHPLGKPVAVVGASGLDQRAEELVHADAVREVGVLLPVLLVSDHVAELRARDSKERCHDLGTVLGQRVMS